jgi:hypothetical protein
MLFSKTKYILANRYINSQYCKDPVISMLFRINPNTSNAAITFAFCSPYDMPSKRVGKDLCAERMEQYVSNTYPSNWRNHLLTNVPVSVGEVPLLQSLYTYVVNNYLNSELNDFIYNFNRTNSFVRLPHYSYPKAFL